MITIFFAIVVIVTFYIYGTSTFNYWKVRGIKYDEPLPFVGNNLKTIIGQKSMTQMAVEIYWKYPKEKVVGFFRMNRPELVIRDPEIIKRILVTDFTYFYPRGLITTKTLIEPLLKNLFFADGDLWRLLRQRMTPAFTSGKLKAMFPLIVERAEKLRSRALAAATAGHAIDARDLMARYTTDFIGACGFGIDTDSLTKENSAFRSLGENIFQSGIKELFTAVMKDMFPEKCKHLKYLSKIEKDLIDLVNAILKQRNYEPSGRNDFIDLLLECRKKGTIIGESIEKSKSDGTPALATLEMDELLMAAQVFVFFAAGFETSSSATSFTLHQLAYNLDKQTKVQAEVDRVLAKYDNKLSYDAIKEMTYLECAFKEGMRIFPSLGFLRRECARQYTFPELNLSIDEGVAVMIPLQALHNDSKYFDEPQQFRPERFFASEIDPKNRYVYLPFGEGPRVCIGERLGMMQSLAGLAMIMSRCTVEPVPQTKRYPMVEPRSWIVQGIRGGLPLLFRKRTVMPS